ncbi:MAG TPA: S1 RNA-binding domain-containing protein [Tepidisphaeraceae bacterium]|jgi:small subunit ribosomal protein S1|nr:S1 RNA-binding domain-containing protein [Tepidisphaeraceae bacterium]
MSEQQVDPYKEKFRADADPELDKQVDAALAGLSLDQLMETNKRQESDKPEGQSSPPPTGGNVRRGKVVSIGKDDVFVDFGGKSQGICSLLQFNEVKIGDEFDFNVDRYDESEGLLLLNRKGVLTSGVNWENLEIGQIVEGLVTGMNKGGLELDIKGMRAFMPAGQVDLYFNKDISVFLSQKMVVEVTQFDRTAHNLVVSRRHILEREKEEQKKKLMAELAVDQMRRGVVRNVTDFGAFVDLGGVDGLLHVSEMSHRRGRHPSEFVKVNDLVDVKVTRIDPNSGKISLSLKAAMADPWNGVETRYTTGTQLTGRVVRVEPFGAFIEVEEGIEGLLPVSEMSWQRIRHPADIVKEGDTIKLVVLTIDPTARKMTFSLKQAGPDPWAGAAEKYPVHSVVTGTVTRVVDFGAFVELEPGLEGLIHISELAPTRIRAASDVVKPGQEVKARVMEINKDARRISLSLKRAVEPVAAAAPAAPAGPPPKKKKRPELRGGLDWNW